LLMLVSFMFGVIECDQISANYYCSSAACGGAASQVTLQTETCTQTSLCGLSGYIYGSVLSPDPLTVNVSIYSTECSGTPLFGQGVECNACVPLGAFQISLQIPCDSSSTTTDIANDVSSTTAASVVSGSTSTSSGVVTVVTTGSPQQPSTSSSSSVSTTASVSSSATDISQAVSTTTASTSGDNVNPSTTSSASTTGVSQAVSSTSNNNPSTTSSSSATTGNPKPTTSSSLSSTTTSSLNANNGSTTAHFDSVGTSVQNASASLRVSLLQLCIMLGMFVIFNLL